MNRTQPPLQLTKSPLVLVLCQVRISAVRDMAKYIPKLQDRLRREEFPVDASRELVELNVPAEGSVTKRRRAHWEFRTLQEDCSIIVGESAVSIQTTAYSSFERFLDVLLLAMTAVDKVVGDLVVERVGLRYVNLIEPQPHESWKNYVQPGYHGQENELMGTENTVSFMQTVADTGPNQSMIVRLAQNREGALVPPDLVPHRPVLERQAEEGKLITLLDLDHFRESREPFRIENVMEKAWELHAGLDVMFRAMVTPHALETWA